MSNVLENIARENFRSSGYLTHPSRERRTAWTFTALPHRTSYSTDSVHTALQRREQAQHRQQTQSSFLKTCLNVFLHR